MNQKKMEIQDFFSYSGWNYKKFPEKEAGEQSEIGIENCDTERDVSESVSMCVYVCSEATARLIWFGSNYKCQYVVFGEWNSMQNIPITTATHSTYTENHLLSHTLLGSVVERSKDFMKFMLFWMMFSEQRTFKAWSSFLPGQIICEDAFIEWLNIAYHHRKQNICWNGVRASLCLCECRMLGKVIALFTKQWLTELLKTFEI